MNLDSLKSFDWRSLKKYTSPQASGDLNKFLEKLPQNTNQTLLIVMAIVWSCAGALGLYTTIQMQAFTELRAELQEMEAVKPVVPNLVNQSIDRNQIARFVDQIKKTYKNINIQAKGSEVNLSAKDTRFYGQFREAIGHIQNGGSGWVLEIDRLCVGRECKSTELSAVLKINKITVEMPS